jgi:MFS family permease
LNDLDLTETEISSESPLNGNFIIASLCLVNLLANCSYSLIAPFYPEEAAKKGVPELALGLVFSSYSVSMFIFSPVYKFMLDRFGSKKQLILGLVCEGFAMLVFGFFEYIDNPVWFACCGSLCRFVEGFGNGCLNSSCK